MSSLSVEISGQFLKGINDTAGNLARIRERASVPSIPDFLSRTQLPKDPSLRELALTAYACALVPDGTEDAALARCVLDGAMLAVSCQTNDRKAHDGEPADATPEMIADFLSSFLSLLQPTQVGQDPLWEHLRHVILFLPCYDHGIALTERWESLRQASAPERRRAIKMALDAIGLVAPPEYVRVRSGGTLSSPLYTLMRKSLEEPYNLDYGVYLAQEFVRRFNVEHTAVAACLDLMTKGQRRHPDEPSFD